MTQSTQTISPLRQRMIDELGQWNRELPPGYKPQINPTNLTHSTPTDSPQSLVGSDIASVSSSASGVWEQKW